MPEDQEHNSSAYKLGKLVNKTPLWAKISLAVMIIFGLIAAQHPSSLTPPSANWIGTLTPPADLEVCLDRQFATATGSISDKLSYGRNPDGTIYTVSLSAGDRFKEWIWKSCGKQAEQWIDQTCLSLSGADRFMCNLELNKFVADAADAVGVWLQPIIDEDGHKNLVIRRKGDPQSIPVSQALIWADATPDNGL